MLRGTRLVASECGRTVRSAIAGRSSVLVLAALLTAPGCYSYTGTTIEALEPGEEVRVTLTASGAASALPGSPGADNFEARFTEARPDSLEFSVWIGAAYRGTPFESTYQTIVLPRSDVTAVEDRQLSRNRTALVAVGVVAVILTIIDQLEWVPIFSTGDDDSPGGIPEPEGIILR